MKFVDSKFLWSDAASTPLRKAHRARETYKIAYLNNYRSSKETV